MAKQSAKKREALVAQSQAADQPRQEVAKKRREDRLKSYERNRRQWMITKIAAAVLAIAIVGAIVLVAINWGQDRNLNQIPDGVQTFAYAGGQHDDAFSAWTETPPAGGIHNNTWQKCGFYDGQIAAGKGVHSLEHGAVWITYSPDLPQDQIDTLKSLASQDFVLVSEFPGLPSPIVASAWNKQLKLQDAGAEELTQFVRVFKNNPDYTPEYGATCATGSEDTIA